MIVVPEPGGWRCITQPDHAALSASILTLWRTAPLPDHSRRDDLLLAAREHDNGWRETDSAPTLAMEGDRPLHFLDVPAADRLEIWTRGVERYRPRNPFVAALIAEHGWFLHRDGSDSELAAALHEIRDSAIAEANLDPAEVAADYRWLHLVDLLSLLPCARWTEPVERWGCRAWWRDETVLITPFPLAGATTFTVSARTVPRRRYTGDADLAVELADAQWEEVVVRLAPGEPGALSDA